MKKKIEWIKNWALEERIITFVPEFGNMDHVRAGQCWAELQPLYARQRKGKKTLELIDNLEHEIGTLLHFLIEPDKNV